MRRSKMSGCLVRKPSGLYMARWKFAGKVYTRSTKTDSKKKALEVLDEYTRPYRERTEVAVIENLEARLRAKKGEKRMSLVVPLQSIYGEYLKTTEPGSLTDATRAIRKSMIKSLTGWLEVNRPDVKSMKDVSEDDARGYLEYISGRLWPATYNQHLSFLKLLWRSLARVVALDNVWEKHKNVPCYSETRREITKEELQTVVNSTEGELRLLILVGMYTGLRLGDAATLDWSEVNLMRGQIALLPDKVKKYGVKVRIPIHLRLHTELKKLPMMSSGPVMPAMKDAYLHNKANVMVREAFRKCGIQTSEKRERGVKSISRVGFHALRHTFVSTAVRSGVPLTTVQAIVGHSSAEMTAHYVRVAEEEKNAAVEAIPTV